MFFFISLFDSLSKEPTGFQILFAVGFLRNKSGKSTLIPLLKFGKKAIFLRRYCKKRLEFWQETQNSALLGLWEGNVLV
ncbi:hypothetical protein DVG78_11510 [Runella aurantiaca]|uniref:Uncharacterized protein n=1 Tax=Runella aurantiaca TaxID=2282308 RepID=A0A369IFL1_9BACT|nr:hypothetical protein DVG78_11510 [Runella aurantiaca]